MKRRILTFGVVMALALVMVPVVPGAVLANGSTNVTGNVTEGYTFTAPSAINLGNMAPSTTPYKGNSTDGNLAGNHPSGYTVTGIDAKGTYTGYMIGDTTLPLKNRLEISNEDASYVPADTAKEFVNVSGPIDTVVSLYVSQLVAYNDLVDTGYTITITFTVTPK